MGRHSNKKKLLRGSLEQLKRELEAGEAKRLKAAEARVCAEKESK